jgi:hypothetical protein
VQPLPRAWAGVAHCGDLSGRPLYNLLPAETTLAGCAPHMQAKLTRAESVRLRMASHLPMATSSKRARKASAPMPSRASKHAWEPWSKARTSRCWPSSWADV